MSVTVQVIYPATEGTHFDHDYYAATHMPMVAAAWGAHVSSQLVTKGLAGGPDTPPGYHAIASFVFADQAAMGAAMDKAGPLLEDIPNFTNTQPQVLIGETIG
ncbi:EthD family reductase [Mameliella sediminis]|uniref:EthD family reductase n=1 Tax=Mameliella sediminis TaxID=2836866 RepID=UPI001C449A77|nr:EthD family reductase [Mameliella sediminis]MBV7395472.1 EthD family reductase [Mameliella sediminis]MBY6159305.1 EthD family reductase [Mameliella alba]MBY6167776.1 EthD family reductase [Mameliella alba]MBY6172797.1 EthD family reductase [Mameliella alba]